MILSFFKVPRGAVVHFFSAIGTVGNAGKEVALARSCRSAFVAAQLLYPLKGVLIHNGFVGVAEYLPLLRWILDGLLDFVGLPVRFEVHGMPAILHPFQNCSNGAAVPVVRIVRQSAADFSFLPVLINGGRQYMILFQHPGNLRRTVRDRRQYSAVILSDCFIVDSSII